MIPWPKNHVDKAPPIPIGERIRILVRYDDPLLAAGLMAIIREQRDFELVAGTADLASDDAGLCADVVIADYVRGLECIAGARHRARTRPSKMPCVLILTQRDSEREIRHALENGAQGYLTLGCDLDELLIAVRTLHRGLRHLGAVAARRMADSIASELLTAREMDVLRLLVEGHANKSIAKRLDIAAGTVKTHLKGIFQKLGAATRTEVAAVAERRGLLGSPLWQ
ncbi:MAG: LuxR family transcriptional regulator [Proteobacteria bacterium]|nr:LuxR family transcriptional regulator [Pseudomonadota bacterium]